jgi:hypothetical protein
VTTFAQASSAQSSFEVGTGNAEIKYPGRVFPVEGFTGVHDPIHIRVLLLNDGNTRIALMVVDQTSLKEDVIQELKDVIKDVTDIPYDNSIIIASHSFSIPHIIAENAKTTEEKEKVEILRQSMLVAAKKAAEQAKTSVQPARVGYGTGESNVNVSRDMETPLGWWLGYNSNGYSDHSLNIIRFDGADGRPIAAIANFAVQSSIMDHSTLTVGGSLITADLAGSAMHFMESYYNSNITSLFLIGAAGDQSPLLTGNRYVQETNGAANRQDMHETGFALVDAEGERLGGDMVHTFESIHASATPMLRLIRDEVTVNSQERSAGLPTGPVHSYAYKEGPSVKSPVLYLQLGDIVIVGVRPELSAEIGREIKAKSPFTKTVVGTLVDGGAKYMPEMSAYDRYTYEARNSGFARGAAESEAEQIVKKLVAIQQQQ